MSRSQYLLLILFAFTGGLIGGFASTRLLPQSELAYAQNDIKQTKHRQINAKTIIAEEIFLHAKSDSSPLDGEIPLPRALLTTEPDGSPKLIMQDSDGNPRFSVQVEDKNGTTLALLNEDGEQRLLVSEKISYGNTPTASSVALLDNNGKIRAQMGVQADNNPFLSLNDPPSEKKGASRNIKLCFMENDKASISVSGIEGNPRAELIIDSEGTCLSLKDLKGGTRAELGNTKLAFGTDGSLKKSSSDFSVEKRPLSSLVLYNEKGKVVWSAP